MKIGWSSRREAAADGDDARRTGEPREPSDESSALSFRQGTRWLVDLDQVPALCPDDRVGPGGGGGRPPHK